MKELLDKIKKRAELDDIKIAKNWFSGEDNEELTENEYSKILLHPDISEYVSGFQACSKDLTTIIEGLCEVIEIYKTEMEALINLKTMTIASHEKEFMAGAWTANCQASEYAEGAQSRAETKLKELAGDK